MHLWMIFHPLRPPLTLAREVALTIGRTPLPARLPERSLLFCRDPASRPALVSQRDRASSL